MDAKKVALIIGITVLLPLFLGLFFDAIYPSPEYDKYCSYRYPDAPAKLMEPVAVQPTCPDIYNMPESRNCYDEKGEPRYVYNDEGCQVFDKCDYCSKDYNQASAVYNRNLFFILAPVGLAALIVGIYLSIDYIGVGLMLGGLITIFYATVRYFSEMSKLGRAFVILAELLIIIWLGLKKIGRGKENEKPASKVKKRR